MANVFTIKNGTCAVDWAEYDLFRDKLGNILKDNMEVVLSELPLQRAPMAKDLIDKFLPAKEKGGEKRGQEICDVLIRGQKEDDDVIKFDERKAKGSGFFVATTKLRMAPCTKEPEQYYFNGDHSCKDISSIIKTYFIPGTMALLPY